MRPTARALARTYSGREYSDPLEKVLDYRRVREHAAGHPAHGRTRVRSALDLAGGSIKTQTYVSSDRGAAPTRTLSDSRT